MGDTTSPDSQLGPAGDVTQADSGVGIPNEEEAVPAGVEADAPNKMRQEINDLQQKIADLTAMISGNKDKTKETESSKPEPEEDLIVLEERSSRPYTDLSPEPTEGRTAEIKYLGADMSQAEFIEVIRVSDITAISILAFVHDKSVAEKKVAEEGRYQGDPERDPARIILNNQLLITALEEIVGEEFDGNEGKLPPTPCVFLPPYKFFHTYWDRIQSRLDDFEKEYETTQKIAFDEDDDTERKDKNSEQQPDSEKQSPAKDEAKEDSTLPSSKFQQRMKITHMRLLVGFLKSHLQYSFNLRKRIDAQEIEKIGFRDLWHLFKLGDFVVSRQGPGRAPSVFQLCSTRGGRRQLKRYSHKNDTCDEGLIPDLSVFQLGCLRLAYNGSEVGPTSENRDISPYHGEIEVTKLEVFPYKFISGVDKTWDRVLRRGRLFQKCRYGHSTYEGTADGKKGEERVEGEVFVDFDSGYELSGFARPDLSLPSLSKEDDETYLANCYSLTCESCPTMCHSDETIDVMLSERFIKSDKCAKTLKDSEIDKLDDELVALLPYEMIGFSLRRKDWFTFDVEKCEKVDSDADNRDKGFDRLVIPRNYKEMLKALVDIHASGNDSRDEMYGKPHSGIDLVKGKGKGLIIFLYGPPGVGKTSTAETIAAYTSPPRPLYQITCGDLGSTPQDVETRLENHFRLAHRWNCVLLLDEADVYLAERSFNDLERNGIVSVFLRTLEYYSGILFLTSNREGSIDEAFKSRIHIALRYKPIDLKGTTQIWENIITGIEMDNEKEEQKVKIQFHPERQALIDWAKKHFRAHSLPDMPPTWNGRQIRNAFQTAIALSSYERLTKIKEEGLSEEKALTYERFKCINLDIKHFKEVAKVVRDFEEYLILTRGSDEERFAYESLRGEIFEKMPLTPQSAYSYGESRQQGPRSRGQRDRAMRGGVGRGGGGGRGRGRGQNAPASRGPRRAEYEYDDRPSPSRRHYDHHEEAEEEDDGGGDDYLEEDEEEVFGDRDAY